MTRQYEREWEMSNLRILIIDDDLTDIALLKSTLESEGLKIDSANNVHDGLKLIKAAPLKYSVAIVDNYLPMAPNEKEQANGAFASNEIRKISPDIFIFLYSNSASIQAQDNSVQVGINFLVPKSTDLNELVGRVLKAHNEALENEIITDFEPTTNSKKISEKAMVGKSNALAGICDQIGLFGPKSSPVLIRGETGTGKELIARALHESSERSNYPFVAINCGAIPESLIESELFGHLKGSFSGAHKNKTGKFKLADRGTIFLDEIGDLPHHLQVKLLRVLQEMSFEPVGGIQPVVVDVRIIAATHVDLERAIENGKFREDLFYRLNVLEISVPPLRERPEDIEPLVIEFLKKEGSNKHPRKSAIKVLERQPWKGNVRELQNVVQKLTATVKGPYIEKRHLDESYLENKTNALKQDEFNYSWSRCDELVEQYSNDLRKNLIIATLKRSNGSLRPAARQLEMAPSSLSDQIKKFQLQDYTRSRRG